MATQSKKSNPGKRKATGKAKTAAGAELKQKKAASSKATSGKAVQGKSAATNLTADKVVPIGRTPKTKFRGDPDVFGRLVEDHDRHRALLARVEATKGMLDERDTLFTELVKELKAHAAAEEQALWSTVLRDPATTDSARHAIAEHKEIDDMLADLAARDMASSAWLRRFAGLKEKYLHHIREEEQEQFVAAEDHLSGSDVRYMRRVFSRRKKAEKAAAKIEKKIRLKA